MTENDPDTSDQQQRYATRRAVLRFARLATNALSIGLTTTMLLAVVVLWIEKRSGVELDREQYRGLLLIIFLVITLSAYVVLEFFQHRQEVRAARDAKARKPKRASRHTAESFAPIFVEPATPAVAPAEAPPPEGLPPEDLPDVTDPSAAAAPFATAADADAGNITAPVTVLKDASATLFAQAINAAVAGLQEDVTAFLQFGLHLYVMGGCGELVRRQALTPARGKAVLMHMLSDLGLSQRSAAAFAANANTFAQVPNFRGPVDAGYRAMAHLHDAGFMDLADMSGMLEQWRVQDGICNAPEPMTFVATSIGAPPPGAPPEDKQRVMRAHNKAMAMVLERFQGREVHDLGNGVIAAFADAAQAVRAAEGCQEYLDLFALENPKLFVAPRIGIDTEMAAAVNGTYVSVAMTRAVTIAALTPIHYIYCSEATCEDAAAVVDFESTPSAEGYADLPTLFAAVWSRMPARSGPAVEYRQIGTMVDINPALG